MENKELTCIVCPMGCRLTALVEKGEVTKVTGNGCKRGDAYAREELIHPMRTLTTTMRSEKGNLIPVKTNRPVPKESLFACMQAVASVRVKEPIVIGETLIANVADTGADVVATADQLS